MQANQECSIYESNKLLVVHNYKAGITCMSATSNENTELAYVSLHVYFIHVHTVTFHSMKILSRHTRGLVASSEQLRSLDSLHDQKINSEKVWIGRGQPTLFCHGICRMDPHSLLVMQVSGLDLFIYYMRHSSMTSIVPTVTFLTHASTIHFS